MFITLHARVANSGGAMLICVQHPKRNRQSILKFLDPSESLAACLHGEHNMQHPKTQSTAGCNENQVRFIAFSSASSRCTSNSIPILHSTMRCSADRSLDHKQCTGHCHGDAFSCTLCICVCSRCLTSPLLSAVQPK